MNVVLATILLMVAIPLHAAEENDAFVGKVKKVSSNHLDLDLGDSLLMIGFVSDPSVVPALESIEVGQEVRAVFGATPNADGRLINKLVSIRVCAQIDAECDAERARQVKEGEEFDRQAAASQMRHQRCRQAMQETLASDHRYVPEQDPPASESVLAKYNALSGERRSCAEKMTRQHTRAVLDACELHHCGDNVGGGCWHIAGYATTMAALERAVEKCGG